MNNEKVGGSVPVYLNKIYSDKKAIEIQDILVAIHPTHSERLYLVGFLKHVDYSMGEVLDIIREEAHWNDFNEKITAYQVGTIFRQPLQRTQNHAPTRSRKWDLSPVEVLRIRRQHSISLSRLLCEESKNKNIFPHPERLGIDAGPTATYLKK